MGAKQVWLKDGKLQTYSNKWEDVNVGPTPTPVPVTGVSLDQHTATIQPEGTLQLTATITPSDATDKKVTWTTSDDTIATVSSTGLVTAGAGNGEATITVKTRDGNFTDTCVVTVSSHTPEVQDVELTSFPEGLSNTLFVGRAIGTGIKVTPYTASNVQVTVTSSDTAVVSVGEVYYDPEPSEYNIGTVTITGVSEGQATVTVTSIDNPSVSKTYSFSVQADIPVTGITGVSTATPTAYTGTPGVIFDAYYTPSNAVAPNEDIVCTPKEGQTDIGSVYCMNTELGTAHMGMSVTPDAVVGTSSIYELFTNRAPENKIEITITVAEGIENFNIASQDITVVAGGVDTSNEFTYLPTTADINSIQVWTLDPTVATAELMKTVDGSGYVKVTGVSEGSTTVIIGKEYYTQHASFGVTVEAATPVSSISNFSTTSNVNMIEGGSTTLTFDYLPVDAGDFSNITFLQDVQSYDADVEVSASVTSYINGVATLTIQGIDAGDNTGTYGLKVYLNGQDTGTMIVGTVFKTVTVTLGTTNSEKGTVSPASIEVPLGASANISADFSVVTFTHLVMPDFTATATATGMEGYVPSSWDDGQGGGITRPLNNINQDITLRCSFEEVCY